ncbi:hypothetical protein CDCA_CDCA08G2288 [Cyanidium caldarium]|uniref:Uncharacterized protein n=1 Tax=Cyanidium caldarium TaxID=2771 RepID=A0AAV9IVE6_CYACA|nr:hypothetical protein CDCA_CDCA08G2288 [Cyanidium caldarium]
MTESSASYPNRGRGSAEAFVISVLNGGAADVAVAALRRGEGYGLPWRRPPRELGARCAVRARPFFCGALFAVRAATESTPPPPSDGKSTFSARGRGQQPPRNRTPGGTHPRTDRGGSQRRDRQPPSSGEYYRSAAAFENSRWTRRARTQSLQLAAVPAVAPHPQPWFSVRATMTVYGKRSVLRSRARQRLQAAARALILPYARPDWDFMINGLPEALYVSWGDLVADLRQALVRVGGLRPDAAFDADGIATVREPGGRDRS